MRDSERAATRIGVPIVAAEGTRRREPHAWRFHVATLGATSAGGHPPPSVVGYRNRMNAGLRTGCHARWRSDRSRRGYEADGPHAWRFQVVTLGATRPGGHPPPSVVGYRDRMNAGLRTGCHAHWRSDRSRRGNEAEGPHAWRFHGATLGATSPGGHPPPSVVGYLEPPTFSFFLLPLNFPRPPPRPHKR